MFLNRITLSGFKSFADRVEIEFGRGVTGIVGPNGCGKSNVLDSLKWVLGEQSARSLRGKQMVDMIFNGSSTRRSSSVAQVDLTFGNEDRTLPVDRDEIVVTRKLYRSGESEYLLNQESARLKDIRELFMDTGVGVDAYSVIEQGRVDALLQSSPGERRIIFEEAAGISKYKARKKEAQRKLERTQQNLQRAEDIIEELERRLRSVKLQAGKARNYKEYESRLSELRSEYAMAEYHRFAKECGLSERQAEVVGDQVTSMQTQIDQLEAQDARGVVALDAVSESLARTDNEAVKKRSALAGLEERIEAARSRIEEQDALLERSELRLRTDERRVQQNQSDLEAATEAAADLVERIEQNRAEIAALNDRDGALARRLAEHGGQLEEDKAAVLDLLRKSGQARNEIVRLSSYRESLVTQKGRLSERDAKISSELESQLDLRADLERDLHRQAEVADEKDRALERLKIEASRVDTARQTLVDQAASLKEHRSALVSRRGLLLELQEKHDGVGEGVRQWLAATGAVRGERAPNSQDVGGDEEAAESAVLVADMLDADVEHAPLIESILGDRDQCLVIASAEVFLRQASALGTLAGRITAICLDRIPPVVNERDFSEEPGFVARALDLVRVAPKYERCARHLLAKTVVVRDLPAAMAMAARDVAGHLFATLDGELLQSDGRVCLGPVSSGTGLISRRSELAQIEGQLAGLDDDLTALEGELSENRSHANDLEEGQQVLRSELFELNTKKVDIGGRLAKAAEAIDRLSREKPLIDREVAMIDQQVEEVLTKSEAGSRELERIERENDRYERRVAQRQTEMDEVEALRGRLQQDLTELKVAAGSLAEKRATALESINALSQAARELEDSVVAAKQDMQQARSRIEDSRRTIQAGLGDQQSIATSMASLEAEARTLRETRDRLRSEADGRQRNLKEARPRLHTLEGELHACQMALAENKVRVEELVARTLEELDIDLVARYADYTYEEQDWDSLEEEINQLREKMSRLGNVNLNAIDELAELEERHGFLAGQRDDLRAAHRQLEQLIEQLDHESITRFNEAFALIRENFRALFRKLFGGGKAEIILEDEEHPLESGIEIVAQPPGKELQIISLMSGGEKSLTAIALLMSIFKCRPAPFVILDEVDAALDEANNERFNLIIQEFVAQSQFIVITHSKSTMGIAEQLYGITMQEPGVSTLVNVQLSDAQVA